LEQLYTALILLKIELKTVLNEGGRGMELSLLVKFWNNLYTCDDRSGIIYQLMDNEGSKMKAIPKHILMEGDGNNQKGFKCEWATVKNDLLYIGSFGKEWSTPEGVRIKSFQLDKFI
jgi:soluble calcium-activated nucleotidase 1